MYTHSYTHRLAPVGIHQFSFIQNKQLLECNNFFKTGGKKKSLEKGFKL